MTPTKEQIEAARQFLVSPENIGTPIHELLASYALQHLPRWIPVEERLPDESMAKDLPDNIGKIVEVLVSDGNYVFTDIFVIEVNRFLDFGSAFKFWMLRPTPPTK